MGPTGLEVPVFGARAAAHAVKAGASRIELNAAGSYPAGGLTPSVEDLRSIVNLDVPLRVMIRPRGPPSVPSELAPAPQSQTSAQARDFIYSDQEIEQMHDDILALKDSGLLKVDRGDGFVFGVLTEQVSTTSQSLLSGESNALTSAPGTGIGAVGVGCEVDIARCTRLIEAVRPFKVVFHRAFDEIVSSGDGLSGDKRCLPWQKGLEDLEYCGFDGILTSGGLGSAVQNTETLAEILDEAAKKGIEIIVGGGVRSVNIQDLLKRLHLSERKQPVLMHSSCLVAGEMEHVNPLEVEAIVSQLR
ncbi:hypothetical protein SLS62_009901 [Diatrype stigma]|uniref:Copper homeostasis protein cutC homolog n=1 Tax=Diatrype stigma TaxID=117547 RepID=A0AAN9YHL4_9PEZI